MTRQRLSPWLRFYLLYAFVNVTIAAGVFAYIVATDRCSCVPGG